MDNNYGIDSSVLDYLIQKRKPKIEPLPQSNQMTAVLADTAAKLGTVGGQTADTRAVQKFADASDARNRMAQNQQMAMQSDENKRQMAIASLLDQYKMRQDAATARADERASDRDFKLAMQKQKRSQELEDRERNLQDKMALENIKADNKLAIAKAEREAKPKQLGKAQEAVDKEFAKEYADFTIRGKEAAAQSMNILTSYIDKMEGQKDKIFQSGGGPLKSMTPDFIRGALGGSEGIKMRDEITGVALEGLKQIFSGATSDRELKSLASTFYNDNLGPNENISILQRKLKTMQDMYQNKLAMSQYYEQNGTLQGFKGLSEADMLSRLREKDPTRQDTVTDQESGTAYAEPVVKSEDDQALEWARSNPDDPRAKQIMQMLGK